MKYYAIILTVILCFTSILGNSQIKDSTKVSLIYNKLRDISQLDSAYLEKIDISSSKLPLSEIIKNIASISKVNISIQSGENKQISCNFNRVTVIDIIYFLCKEYSFDIEIIGNIISMFPYNPSPPKKPEPVILYDKTDSLLTFDITNSPLIDVTKKITNTTGINLIIPQSLYNCLVSGSIHKMYVYDAINSLISINNLELRNNAKGSFIINGTDNKSLPIIPYRPIKKYFQNNISIDSLKRISCNINNGNCQDIIIDVFERMHINYHFIEPVTKQVSIYVNNIDLSAFLKILLVGTNFSWNEQAGIYFFGVFDMEKSLISSRVISMQYRSVDKIQDRIPEMLKSNLHIQTFAEMNAIIVSGDQKYINDIEFFIKSLDTKVPLVTIDVIIVETKKSVNNDTGISMGVGDSPAITKGTLSPGADFTINATDLDNLIKGINGFGPINLGQILPNFYMNLKFLEETGNIELKSTPKLSTLNGNEASLKSGETKFYKEIQSSLYGAQNPVESRSYVWKSVEANLSLKIIPFVSKDSSITLNIELEQSEFTPRTDAEAPPGLTTRSFKSIISVKSNDVVLLGGIERNALEKSSEGLPFIARIPVLKWIFGRSVKANSDQKLNVFIKPTLVY
jgi:type IV pilus assembly protein PilQ